MANSEVERNFELDRLGMCAGTADRDKSCLPVPNLIVLKSPFRFVATPIVDYALRVQSENPNSQIAILVPELIENHWYNFLLHNNRPQLLKALLNLKENPKITVINIPWYLNASDKETQVRGD